MSDMQDNRGGLLRGLVAGTLAAAAMAGFNYLSDEAAPDPPDPLGGEHRTYPWRLGTISFNVAGPAEGPPMLLLHGIHAAASNWEFRKQFSFFAEKGYRVFAPDMLGFGASDRPAIAYSDELYVALVADFVRDVMGGVGVTVIASTLSCSFVIAAAARYPERFGPLVLIEPVGLEQLRRKAPLVGDLFYAFVRSPLVGETFFNLLTSGPSIRYFMRQQGYHDPALVTDEVVDYHYAVAHQPNARFAPGAFISGSLNRDVGDEWKTLKQPLLLAWGYHATTVPVQRGTEFLRLNPRAVVNGYEANQLPHDETAERFNSDTLAWLEGRRKD